MTHSQVDLEAIRQLFMSHFESIRDTGGPYGCYRMGQGKRSDLYSAIDVALCRGIMGEDLATSLTPAQRQQWIDHLNSYLREDGTCTDVRGRHSALHANGQIIGALGVLGGRLARPVNLYEEFDTPAKLPAWLERQDWARVWRASHELWGGLVMFSRSSRCTDAWREAAFAWLDANLDPQAGWWRKGTPHADRNQGLGGVVHILPIYQHNERLSRCPASSSTPCCRSSCQAADGTSRPLPPPAISNSTRFTRCRT